MAVMTFLLERIRAWRTDFSAIRMPDHDTANSGAFVQDVSVQAGDRGPAVDLRGVRKNCAPSAAASGKFCAGKPINPRNCP
jgi:hypothetical protein